MKKFFVKKAILDAFYKNDLKEIYYVSYFDEIFLFKQKNIILHKVEKSFFNDYDINHQYIMGISNSDSFGITTNFDEFIERINASKKLKKIILVLDEIHDPGNFGAICRTCKAFDVVGIIFKKNNQTQITDTVLKTSLGTANYLNFYKATNLFETLNKLKKEGFWIISTALDEKAVKLSKFKTDIKNLVLIVGNENKGISTLLKKESDFIVQIEMMDDVQSLNVASSCAIAIYYLQFIL
ncbi:MAG: 23S rRNA (guanosine(2251)-2'-O)-methyltransferase RlmB [Malacoplasma sp.]|nr:23S rRNA (guanosine(2251)-2'-O)-methyltransferase RlmB [Malacoplasma sp.]